MGAQRQRLVGFRLELLDELGPDQARGPHLGDLHEEVHPDRPEKRQARGELVDGQTGRETRLDVFDAIRERVGEFEILCRPGFLHVVAGDGDRVELRHVLRGVAEDVRDDSHRSLGGIDVGVADHELFQDVVLDRAGEFFRRHALLLGGDDVEGEHGQHRAVHRHRHGHLVEGNPREQRAHVVDRVDRDTRHADIARDARMVRIVAAVGREVEGDREALLARREVAPVEGVRIFRRGEAGILPDGPGLGDVHRRIGPAQVGRQAGERVDPLAALAILGAVEALHRNALGRHPRLPGRRRRRLEAVGRVGDGGEIGDPGAHRAAVPGVSLGIGRDDEFF
ncbi:hypothetical protein CJNNKLLH_4533 [Methylorubrum thiocyanatum]|nr:hypothetical protein CJNNKLLH_4533 [Methylorubrum thiocyanatum]